MSDRIYGFDIIRLVFFHAIFIFHLSLMMFYTTEIASSRFSSFSYAFEAYARTFSSGGFVVIFLTCLLMGFSESRILSKLKLFGFMIAAWLIFQLILAPAYNSPVGWDVYPLILFTVSICLVLKLISDRLVYLLSIAGFVMLWIPFWEFRSLVMPMSEPLQNILGFADCNLKEADEWPILPWAGICWMSYGVGLKVGKMWKTKPISLRLSLIELIIWISLLALSSVNYGPMYRVSLGNEFSCAMYRFPPLVFWSHFIWPLFFIRISLDVRVQDYLSRLSISKAISSLTMSRCFWLSYFVAYIYTFILGELYQYGVKISYDSIYYSLPLILLLGFSLSELTANFLERVGRKLLKNYGKKKADHQILI